MYPFQSGENRTRSLLILTCFLFWPQWAHCQTPTVEQIMRAWETRQSQTQTAFFVFEAKCTFPKGMLLGNERLAARNKTESLKGPPLFPEQDATVNRKCEVKLFGDLMYHQSEGPFWDARTNRFISQKYVSTNDGEQAQVFFGKGEGQPPIGTISQFASNEDRFFLGVRPLLMHYRSRSPQLDPFEGKKWTVTPERGFIKERECVILEHQDTSSGLKVLCWVDVSRNSSILRFVQSVNGNTATQIDISYELDDSNRWFPMEWNTKMIVPDTGKLAQAMNARVVRHRLNEPFAKNEFVFQFPAGTLVIDNSNNSRYLMKEGGRKRYITDEEIQRNTTYTEWTNTDEGKAGLPQKSFLRRAFPWVLGGLLVLLTGVVFWWRMRRKIATPQ